MEAVVKKAFPGRPDREVMTRTIAVGEKISGELALVAVREGWAEAQQNEEVAPETSGDGLEVMTVKQLVALANQRQIGLGLARSKAQIIAVIRAAEVTV